MSAAGMADVAALQRQQAGLERRLVDGWRKIDVAIAEGRDVQAWEDHWLRLLADYEAVSERIAAIPN